MGRERNESESEDESESENEDESENENEDESEDEDEHEDEDAGGRLRARSHGAPPERPGDEGVQRGPAGPVRCHAPRDRGRRGRSARIVGP
ncbi:hypothetical protein ACFYXD_25335 [Streptomyces platensis]|uniref:hypothetical protein n=1 Tax=Streptomyces platensis TaxID=58346 RepID=UPI0036A1B6C9